MYRVQTGIFSVKNASAVYEMIRFIQHRVQIKCTTSASSDGKMVRVLVEKRFDDLEEAKEIAQLIFSVCGIPSVVQRFEY